MRRKEFGQFWVAYGSEIRLIAGAMVLGILCVGATLGQTSAFTLQGKLNSSGTGVNGNFDMQVRLFDSADGSGQVGSTLTLVNVPVTVGIFTVQLDFGAAAFNGDDRWVQISVSPAGQNNYSTLTPRQKVTSTPYSIQSSNASTADTAGDSLNLGGVPANQYVQTNDLRLSDARVPLPGSNDYVQNNTNAPQAGVNFNIGGTGSANILNAQTQFNLAGNRIVGVSGGVNSPNSNIFVGIDAGASNTEGTLNSFFGKAAGQNNTTGAGNSFFGNEAGRTNNTGSNNSFFGIFSGFGNTGGSSNSFFGALAGFGNTGGGANAFFGEFAGFTTSTGSSNSFFGRDAGRANTTGFSNSFFGNNTGTTNSAGNNLTLIGRNANVGSDNLSFATAIGAGAPTSA